MVDAVEHHMASESSTPAPPPPPLQHKVSVEPKEKQREEAGVGHVVLDALRAIHDHSDALSVARAGAPGDSYCSTIYRASTAALADGTRSSSLLVKVLPQDDETMAKAVCMGGHFHRETAMMTRILPAMQALLEEACPGGFPPFAARCLLHAALPEPFLVLEDLAPQGFRLAERRRGLGLRHCLLALRSLARFHAASAALLNAHPTVADDLGNPLQSSGSPFLNFTTTTHHLAALSCRDWAGFEAFAEDLDHFWPIALDKYAQLNERVPGRFNVIVHGDYWLNNILFNYSDGVVNGIRLIDFQISHVASPAIDLLYFLNSSVSDDVSEHHEQLLLREYHVALAETLRLLRLPGPSFEELMADVNAHGTYSLFGALGVLPLVRADFAPGLNSGMFDCPAVRRWLHRKLPEFKRRGWWPNVDACTHKL